MRRSGRFDLAALSLPTLVYAGFELGRKSFLPVLLMGAAGLGAARTGVILTIIGTWGIAVEVLFGMICDLAPDPARRRAFWVTVGTVLQMVAGLALWLMPAQGRSAGMWLVCLLTLTGGWVLSNLAHGAWALEWASGVAARARVFGTRAQFGVAGSILFALIVLLGQRFLPGGGPDPFYLILGLTLLGAPLAHALMIWRVEERGHAPVRVRARSAREQARLSLANVLKPFQVCLASPADRVLALLFLLVGAHMGLLGGALLLVIRHRLGLAAWGATAILVQTMASGGGVAWAQGLLRQRSPLGIMAGVFAINLVLALWLPLLPPGRPVAMIAWVMASGATMAVDFTLLRVLLGDRLDREARRDGGAPAAAFYAGFHLPFNLGATLAVAMLFQGLVLAGVELDDARRAVQAGRVLVWLTGGMAAMISALALLGALALQRILAREGEPGSSGGELNVRFMIDQN
jgi:Na+/melibiose symporter-like transporter